MRTSRPAGSDAQGQHRVSFSGGGDVALPEHLRPLASAAGGCARAERPISCIRFNPVQHGRAKRPVVSGGRIAVRSMMNLSSSFDHRIVDDYDAASCIQHVKRLLEYPATLAASKRRRRRRGLPANAHGSGASCGLVFSSTQWK